MTTGDYSETLGQRVRRLRMGRQLTATALGERTGIPKQTISNIERGRTLSPSGRDLAAIAGVLGVPVNDLLVLVPGGGAAGKYQPAPPHYAVVQAGLNWASPAAWLVKMVPLVRQRVSASGLAPVEAESLPIAVPRDGNYLAVRVSGECMQPKIEPGDIVIIDQDVTPQPGDVCLVEADGEWTLKRLYRSTAEGVELRPDNAAFPAITIHQHDARVLGVVQAIQKGKP